ncbi:MAG: hypothetical protein FJ406_01605 [Verrucomicrobia bacterium]|nr:hypothetical protein [Verrucomicrobiota bacterium]MBM3869830.1 hypothetical protein [Verrucomicrobiota bacterium]
MNFFKALFVWLAIGLFLGWGVYMTVHPTKASFWPLAIAVLGTVAAIGKIGCLPPSDEHHH